MRANGTTLLLSCAIASMRSVSICSSFGPCKLAAVSVYFCIAIFATGEPASIKSLKPPVRFLNTVVMIGMFGTTALKKSRTEAMSIVFLLIIDIPVYIQSNVNTMVSSHRHDVNKPHFHRQTGYRFHHCIRSHTHRLDRQRRKTKRCS